MLIKMKLWNADIHSDLYCFNSGMQVAFEVEVERDVDHTFVLFAANLLKLSAVRGSIHQASR